MYVLGFNETWLHYSLPLSIQSNYLLRNSYIFIYYTLWVHNSKVLWTREFVQDFGLSKAQLHNSPPSSFLFAFSVLNISMDRDLMVKAVRICNSATGQMYMKIEVLGFSKTQLHYSLPSSILSLSSVLTICIQCGLMVRAEKTCNSMKEHIWRFLWV